MPVPAILGAAAPIAGSLIGKAIGGGGPSNAQPVLPKDLQPLRAQNIGLLQYLLGFNQPGPWNQQQNAPQAPQNAPGTPGPNGGQYPGQRPYFGAQVPTPPGPTWASPGSPYQQKLASQGRPANLGPQQSAPPQGAPQPQGGGGMPPHGGIDIASLIQHLGGALPGVMQNPGMPSYAVGTPFVPQTGPAMLHQGEAVVPAHVNPFGVGAAGGFPAPTPTPPVAASPAPTPPPPSLFPTSTVGGAAGAVGSLLGATPKDSRFDPATQLGQPIAMPPKIAPEGPGMMPPAPTPTSGYLSGETPLQYSQRMATGGDKAYQLGLQENGQTWPGQIPQATSGNGANLSPPAPSQFGPVPDTAGRIESYFGQLGTPTTPLQQQSLGGISQYLNSNPYGQSNAALQGILGGGNYGASNQAYTNTGTANLYGGAQGAFNQLGQGGQFDPAQSIFGQLGNFNPFGAATSSLEGQLQTNPGQGILDALQPYFQRNLAAANQEGGRFGSANAIRDSRAVQDYNLLAAQALQQGVGQQQNAASILGMLGQARGGFLQGAGQGMLGVGQGISGNQYNAGQGLLGVGQGQMNQGFGMAGGLGTNAGNLGQQQLGAAGQLGNNANNMFQNYQGAYNTGSAQAQQEAQRQQQALGILQNLLGASFGATLGADNAYAPSGAQQGAQMGGQVGQLIQNGYNGGGGIPAAPQWAPNQGDINAAPQGDPRLAYGY